MKFDGHDWMIISLAVLIVLSLPVVDPVLAIAAVLAAVIGAVVIDEAWALWISKDGLFPPKSAIISGILVGILFPLGTPLYFVAGGAVLAILLKRIVRWGKSHVFNPANTGFLAFAIALGVTGGWWVTPPPDSPLNMARFAAVILLGLWVSSRHKRWTQAFSYLASQAVLLVLVAFALGRPPLELLAFIPWYFAFFMLIEPVCSNTPTRRDAIIYGLLTSVATIVFIFALPLWPHNAALAVGNIFASWRRNSAKS